MDTQHLDCLRVSRIKKTAQIPTSVNTQSSFGGNWLIIFTICELFFYLFINIYPTLNQLTLFSIKYDGLYTVHGYFIFYVYVYIYLYVCKKHNL